MENRVSFARLFEVMMDTFSQIMGIQAQLFQAAMSEKASVAKGGMVNVVIGIILIMPAMMALMAAAVLGLALVMPAWLAALSMALLFMLMGGIFLAVGLGRLKHFKLAPERTISSMKDTVKAVREGWQT
jgi:hypothetical protein